MKLLCLAAHNTHIKGGKIGKDTKDRQYHENVKGYCMQIFIITGKRGAGQ